MRKSNLLERVSYVCLDLPKYAFFLEFLYFGAIPIRPSPIKIVPPHPMGGRTLLLPSSCLFFKDAWLCGMDDASCGTCWENAGWHGEECFQMDYDSTMMDLHMSPGAMILFFWFSGILDLLQLFFRSIAQHAFPHRPPIQFRGRSNTCHPFHTTRHRPELPPGGFPRCPNSWMVYNGKSKNPDDKPSIICWRFPKMDGWSTGSTPIIGNLRHVGDVHRFHWYNLRVKGLKP